MTKVIECKYLDQTKLIQINKMNDKEGKVVTKI